MKTSKVSLPINKFIIFLTVIICAFQALTKGWISFLLIPLSLLILPVYAFVEYKSSKQDSGPYSRWIRYVSILLTVFTLLFYICIVGFGDTDEVLLFGFYRSTNSTLITQISSYISQAANLLAPATLILLIVLLVVNHRKINQST